MSVERMAYVGREPDCGCVTFLMVDDPSHSRDTALEVARCVRDGMAIDRTTVEEARKLPLATCPHWRISSRGKRLGRTDVPTEPAP